MDNNLFENLCLIIIIILIGTIIITFLEYIEEEKKEKKVVHQTQNQYQIRNNPYELIPGSKINYISKKIIPAYN